MSCAQLLPHKDRVRLMAKSKIAFSFVIAEGSNAGFVCGSWRIWTSKEDTYIADTKLGGVWKVSLHSDVAWRYAITSEHAASDNPVLPKGHARAPWKFTPPPFIDGHRLAFAIAVRRSALLPGDVDAKAIPIVVEDSWDCVTFAGVWMTEPGANFAGPDELLGGPLPLASGRQVWLTRRVENVTGEPETGIVGSMIRPLSPEAHGVAAPMLMVQGVKLG